ncbi:hypothetical protein GS534_01920 [Rhodococcus hoagii]|nr:hypothetical protein [Prescottella equi]
MLRKSKESGAKMSVFLLLALVAVISAQIIHWSITRQYIFAAIAVVYLVCYVLDLIMIAGSGEIYLVPSLPVIAVSPVDVELASYLVVLCWITFSALVLMGGRAGVGGQPSAQRSRGGERLSRELPLPRVNLYLALSFAIVAFGVLAIMTAGVDTALLARQNVFGASMTSLLAYFSLPLCFVFGFAVFPHAKPIQRLLVVVVMCAALGTVFLTGSRSSLVLSCLLPASVFLWVRASDRVRGIGKDLLRAIVVSLVVALPFLIGTFYLSRVRGVSESRSVWQSVDLSQADVLVALIGSNAERVPDSYLSALTWFIPRSLWADKPIPGNAVTSMILTPSRYKITGAETTAGLLGEGLIAFGVFGAVTAAVLLYCFARLAKRISLSPSAYSWLLAAVVLFRGLNLIRGDLVNTVTPICVAIVFWLLIFYRRSRPTEKSLRDDRMVATGP